MIVVGVDEHRGIAHGGIAAAQDADDVDGGRTARRRP